MTEQIKKILEDTYDILEQRGWCQGIHMQSDGRVCLEGAAILACGGALTVLPSGEVQVDYAYGGLGAHLPAAFAALGREAAKMTGASGPPTILPFMFNDGDGRSVEDIKLLLKRTIEELGE